MAAPRSSGRIAAVIIGVATILALSSSLSDSPIVDEIPHIGAGYSYVSQFDYRLNPEHPPLIKDLAGLPLLALRLSPDVFQTAPWITEVNGQWNFGRALIFHSGANPDTVKTLARLPMLGIFMVTCWLIWKWSRERYGDRAALLAVTLAAFSPTILAHARLVTTDVGAATGVLVATYCFLKFLRAPGRATFAWAALTLGFALLTKFNTALLGPFFLLVAFIYGWEWRWKSRRAWQRAARYVGLTALVGTVAFVGVVWPFYSAHTWNYPAQRQLADTQTILGWQPDNPLKTIALWAADKPVIRAAGHWTLGLAMVAQRSAGGNTIYWMGRVVKDGGPLYFPTTYFLKESLTWWVLIAAALTALAFHRRRTGPQPARKAVPTGRQVSWWHENLDEWVWLLWLGIYWATSLTSTLNIGVRHLLPIYPFAIMLVAGRISVLLDWLHVHDRARYRWFSAAIMLIVGVYVFSTVRVYPYFLTYFNELAGGPTGGYRYVVDSNLDWGQDAKRLGVFVRDNEIPRICVDYFGWSDVGWYLGTAYQWTSSTQWRNRADFLARNTCDGWIAVSATFLQNSNGEKTFQSDEATGTYRWLLDDPPVAVVGNSIFIWHLEK